MNYQPYPTKKSTPNRMSRKRARGITFIKNKKASKLAREARLELRRQREVERLQLDATEPL